MGNGPSVEGPTTSAKMKIIESKVTFLLEFEGKLYELEVVSDGSVGVFRMIHGYRTALTLTEKSAVKEAFKKLPSIGYMTAQTLHSAVENSQ